MSFNPDADADKDGINDFLEIARDGVNAEIQRSKAQLEREKFEQGKIEHRDKMALEDKKLKKQTNNNNSQNKIKAITHKIKIINIYINYY